MPTRTSGWKLSGPLERRVMEQLWSDAEPRTVREVHAALSVSRRLAYTTVMTVLHRLAAKGLAVQHRTNRAHRYAAARSRDELVASLMLDALDQVDDPRVRLAVLVHFVESVGMEDLRALHRALDDLEINHAPAAKGFLP